jgi:predicted Zn-ribbon and HTH transcriptional regulator
VILEELETSDRLLELDEEQPLQIRALCKRCGHKWLVPWDGRTILSADDARCPICKP